MKFCKFKFLCFLILFILPIVAIGKETKKKEIVTVVCSHKAQQPLKKLGIFSIESGKPKLISEYKMEGRNTAYFVIEVPQENFYVISDTFNYMVPVYLKPGDNINLCLDNEKYRLTGKTSTENKILFEWLTLAYEMEQQSVWFMKDIQTTYETFFPAYDSFLKEAEDFKENIQSKNPQFNELMKYFIDYSLDYYMLSFIYTPRVKHPSYEERQPYLNDYKDEDYFNKKYLDYFHFGADLLRLQSNYFYDLKRKRKEDNNEMGRLNNGDIADDFSYSDREGKTISLSRFKGKLVLIDIWASWCGPCRAQFPHLKELEEEFKESDIVFIGISVDEQKAYKNWIKALDDNELHGIQLFSGSGWSGIIDDYGINAVPTFILIDRDGKIINKNAPLASDPQLRELIKRELEK